MAFCLSYLAVVCYNLNMENIIEKLKELKARLIKVKTLLNIEQKIVRANDLRLQMSEPNFWDNREVAISIGQEVEELTAETRQWLSMEKEIKDAQEMALFVQQEANSELILELEKKAIDLEKEFSRLEFVSLFSGQYDKSNVIISIHAGTGGVDAQDWAQMLERMYFRFCERKGFKAEILDKSYGNEAGLKSVDLRIVGSYAYGYLKSENGVHRLLRNSPFNADGLRQTSFALVEVIPEIPNEGDAIIKDEDIRIDVYRSSGPGGQSVNTTDSAVLADGAGKGDREVKAQRRRLLFGGEQLEYLLVGVAAGRAGEDVHAFEDGGVDGQEPVALVDAAHGVDHRGPGNHVARKQVLKPLEGLRFDLLHGLTPLGSARRACPIKRNRAPIPVGEDARGAKLNEWCRGWGSNPAPLDPQSSALTN